MTDTLHSDDFVTWAERQADELRRLGSQSSNLPLDWDNLAEEIEDLGNEVRARVESLIDQILAYFLKLACSPVGQPRAKWLGEVNSFRNQLEKVLRYNHSIRSRLPEIVAQELPVAFKLAERSLRHHSELQGLEALSAWRQRGIAAEEVLEDGLYPDRTGATMVRDRG